MPVLKRHIIESALGLDHGTLYEELRELLFNYPEKDLNNKAVHYSFYERGRKWLYEGEDRTRFYLWQTTPFYSFPFFQYAAQIPGKYKKHNILYRKFQFLLSPESAKITDANLLVSPTSFLYPWKLSLVKHAVSMPKLAKKIGKGLLGRKSPEFNIPESKSPFLSIESVLSPNEVQLLIENITERQFYNLWTLMTLERVYKKQGIYLKRLNLK
jgi:asparagine synthase (glutamine-hydrolysing)